MVKGRGGGGGEGGGGRDDMVLDITYSVNRYAGHAS